MVERARMRLEDIVVVVKRYEIEASFLDRSISKFFSIPSYRFRILQIFLATCAPN